MKTTTPAPRSTALQLAAASASDPRTAAKWLRGEPVRGLTAERLARAAADLGVAAPSSPPPSAR